MIRWFLKKFGGSIAGNVLRGVAEGKYGSRWQAVYWWLAGKKRVIGAILGGACAVAVALHHQDVAITLGSVGAVLYGSGMLDKSWRTPPKWDTWPAWVVVRNWGAEIVTGLGAVALFFTDCDADASNLLAHVHMTCAQAVIAVTVVTALFTWLKGEAETQEPPKAQ